MVPAVQQYCNSQEILQRCHIILTMNGSGHCYPPPLPPPTNGLISMVPLHRIKTNRLLTAMSNCTLGFTNWRCHMWPYSLCWCPFDAVLFLCMWIYTGTSSVFLVIIVQNWAKFPSHLPPDSYRYAKSLQWNTETEQHWPANMIHFTNKHCR